MISGLILGAGLSRRMGRHKLLLPYGSSTVIEHIVAVYQSAQLEEILLVSGHNHEQIKERLAPYGVRVCFNEDYAAGEMLSSIKTGLRNMAASSEAALLTLGDLPGIDLEIVNAVLHAHQSQEDKIIIPSYQMHGGHPLLIPRRYWRDILTLPKNGALRDYFHRHKEALSYVTVESRGILDDIDTPEEYQRALKTLGSNDLK